MSKPLENVGAYMSLVVLFLMLSFSALTWDRPGINGDEFNFLWPLLTEPISAIGPSRWPYFGPIKTYLTYPLLIGIGFNVELFSALLLKVCQKKQEKIYSILQSYNSKDFAVDWSVHEYFEKSGLRACCPR